MTVLLLSLLKSHVPSSLESTSESVAKLLTSSLESSPILLNSSSFLLGGLDVLSFDVCLGVESILLTAILTFDALF